MLRKLEVENVIDWFEEHTILTDIVTGIIVLVLGLGFRVSWAIGLSVTLVLGIVIGWMFKRVKDGIQKLPVPEISDSVLKNKWDQLDQEPKGYWNPGHVLGILERLLFFFAIWSTHWEIIAGWLTFKVASKWEVYSNMLFVPDKLDGIENIDYLLLRRRRGSQTLMTFLIGTIANVLVALIGVLIGSDIIL